MAAEIAAESLGYDIGIDVTETAVQTEYQGGTISNIVRAVAIALAFRGLIRIFHRPQAALFWIMIALILLMLIGASDPCSRVDCTKTSPSEPISSTISTTISKFAGYFPDAGQFAPARPPQPALPKHARW
jgi:hypothetical protein